MLMFVEAAVADVGRVLVTAGMPDEPEEGELLLTVE
jgi:hypothetical protein